MLAGIAMMPHGNDVLAPKDEETKRLAELLRWIETEFSGLDAYVLVTPHNLRMSDHIGVVFA